MSAGFAGSIELSVVLLLMWEMAGCVHLVGLDMGCSPEGICIGVWSKILGRRQQAEESILAVAPWSEKPSSFRESEGVLRNRSLVISQALHPLA